MTENNYAFIDSQNMYLAIRSQGWKIDLKKFRSYLRDKYQVQKAFFFIGYVPGNEELYKHIQECGFVCIFKPTMELPDGTVKGNVDAELVMHAMNDLSCYDKAVLVTGDGDFFCLVRFLLKKKKLLQLLIPNENRYSQLLKKLSRPDRNILHFMNVLKERLRE